MPHIDSPCRPRLANGKACWMDSLVAIPSVDLRYAGEELWEARIMDGQGAWAIRDNVKTEALPWLLRQWRDDPERACLELFKGRLPKGQQWAASVDGSDFSADELGL